MPPNSGAIKWRAATMDNRKTGTAFWLMDNLRYNGYEIIHTGGGCTAFYKRFGSCEVMITQDASHEIISEYMSDVGLVIGVYPDDLEGQHLFFLNPTHTDWGIIYDSVLKAETAAKVIDGIAAFQKIES